LDESQDNPTLVLLAGPNGSGKSTAAPYLLRGELQVSEFVDADTIARGLSAYAPERVSIEAGKVMLRRLRELAARRLSFGFETTLASRSFAPWIRRETENGYQFRLVYLWLDPVDLCIARVRLRQQAGGHNVPEPTIRRRYASGLTNFFLLYRPLATSWRFYTNRDHPTLVAEGTGHDVFVHQATIWRMLETRYLDAADQKSDD
jgi:predicted ABC-type ATPase